MVLLYKSNGAKVGKEEEVRKQRPDNDGPLLGTSGKYNTVCNLLYIMAIINTYVYGIKNTFYTSVYFLYKGCTEYIFCEQSESSIHLTLTQGFRTHWGFSEQILQKMFSSETALK